MPCFAVIQVNRNHEHEKIVTCIGTFAEKQEADDFVKQIKVDISNAKKARIDYIDKFVNDLVLPKEDQYEWNKFLSKFGKFGKTHVNPNDFKRNLRWHLEFNPGAKMDDFDAPALLEGFDELYIVEIKDVSK